MKLILFFIVSILIQPLFAADPASIAAHEQALAVLYAAQHAGSPHIHAPESTNNAMPEQLYNPGEWTRVRTLTPRHMLETLQAINEELAETQASLDHLTDQIPRNKKEAIDTLLAKWCINAQIHMEEVQCESTFAPAEAFMKAYEKQEAAITTQVAVIERLIQEAQAPENELDGLMRALSLDGRLRDDVLIGDLEDLCLEDPCIE
ncbi:hypothetical protein ACFLXW_00030 [Candidatus Dependentiae bacterium]